MIPPPRRPIPTAKRTSPSLEPKCHRLSFVEYVFIPFFGSTDDIDNTFSPNRLWCLEQALGSFYRRRFFSWLVRWSNSSVDSGKIFALIGGAFGFEESVVIWGDPSRYLTSSEAVFYVASFTIACLLGIVASLVPKIGNMVRGIIIIGASLFVLPILESGGLQFSWIMLMLVGGLLLVFQHRRDASGVHQV